MNDYDRVVQDVLEALDAYLNPPDETRAVAAQ